MIPSEILKRIQKIDIKTRRFVESTLAGEYHSVFKGQGVSFAEVREYQYGDDVRQIDWNVTAKMRTPFVKLFEEERELTVILAVDLSGSGEFGSSEKTKVEVAAELAAVLGFSAIRNNDQVGLVLFSDQVESYVPPRKGKPHVMRILRDIFYQKAGSRKTSIQTALEFILKVQKKKAIVFLISDFMDNNFAKAMQMTKARHDLIPVVITDPRELDLPRVGVVEFEDLETGETLIVNTSSSSVQERFRQIEKTRILERERLFRSISAKPIHIQTNQSIVEPLMTYFRQRMRR